ncbi:ABC-2 family transporter protein [Patescibacteria group bacterium]|nr:ABC-2 family transporter protein [Patescibacteria group bacterium]
MRYIRVYKKLLELNFSALLIYRAHFLNSLVSSVAWGLFSLFSIVLLTSKITVVFGWSRDELLLLNGLYGIIIGCYHVFFSRNFERFSTIIHFGQLDSILVKPIDSQFLLTFWLVGYATFSRVLIALAYTWYIAGILHIIPTVWNILPIAGIMIFSLLTLYSLWFIVITVTIWHTRLSNLTELMFSVTGAARYPAEMLHQLASYIFVFFLPFTLIINIPAKIFLSHARWQDAALLMGVAVGLFLVSRKFWRFALRFYTSASN